MPVECEMCEAYVSDCKFQLGGCLGSPMSHPTVVVLLLCHLSPLLRALTLRRMTVSLVEDSTSNAKHSNCPPQRNCLS